MQQGEWERLRLVLSLLDVIDRQGEQTQRAMAEHFGVALGHVNGCLQSCVQKGHVVVRRLPRRRFLYSLTRDGQAERLRLRLLIFSRDLKSFRQARADYRVLCDRARQAGWSRIVLLGASELAEISALCALESGLQIVAVVDPNSVDNQFLGAPVLKGVESLELACDGALLTDVRDYRAIYAAAACALGKDRVLSPAFLGLEQARAA